VCGKVVDNILFASVCVYACMSERESEQVCVAICLAMSIVYRGVFACVYVYVCVHGRACVCAAMWLAMSIVYAGVCVCVCVCICVCEEKTASVCGNVLGHVQLVCR